MKPLLYQIKVHLTLLSDWVISRLLQFLDSIKKPMQIPTHKLTHHNIAFLLLLFDLQILQPVVKQANIGLDILYRAVFYVF